jgi:hypothetical protein
VSKMGRVIRGVVVHKVHDSSVEDGLALRSCDLGLRRLDAALDARHSLLQHRSHACNGEGKVAK